MDLLGQVEPATQFHDGENFLRRQLRLHSAEENCGFRANSTFWNSFVRLMRSCRASATILCDFYTRYTILHVNRHLNDYIFDVSASTRGLRIATRSFICWAFSWETLLLRPICAINLLKGVGVVPRVVDGNCDRTDDCVLIVEW